MRDQVHVCNDDQALAKYACDWLVRLIRQPPRMPAEIFENPQPEPTEDRPFVIALAGGSTPKHMYELLAALPEGAIDWNRIVLLWGDERNVPLDDPQSNYRMVREALLSKIPIPAENILAVPKPGGSAKTAAKAYEELLRERLPKAKSNEFPRIDCVLLGMGDDAHTASLFPDTKAIAETSRAVVANAVPKLDTWRITLTAPMINAARNVAFLISGEKKQDALAAVWHAPRDPVSLPSQLIRPADGQLWYLLDKPAIGNTPLPESVMVQII